MPPVVVPPVAVPPVVVVLELDWPVVPPVVVPLTPPVVVVVPPVVAPASSGVDELQPIARKLAMPSPVTATIARMR